MDRLGAGPQVEKDEAGEHADPGRQEEAGGGVGGVAELGEDAALEQDAELGPPVLMGLILAKSRKKKRKERF